MFIVYSTIAKGALRGINKVIHKIGIVAIDQIDIYLHIAIIAIIFKAHCPGEG